MKKKQKCIPNNLKKKFIHHISFAILSFILTFTAVSSVCFAAISTKITIVHINDMDKLEPINGQGGFSKLATVLNQERQKNKNLLFTHGGDTISPSILANIDQGKSVIDLFNDLKLDAFTLGNHEFDYGPDVTQERILNAKFPVISTNVLRGNNKAFKGTQTSIMKEFDGIKVGIIGFTTPETPHLSRTGDSIFKPVVESAKTEVQKLKAKGADFIIALAHIDITEDISLLQANIGVDLILGGHSEIYLNYYSGSSALLIAKAQAEYVGVVDILLNKEDAKDGTSVIRWKPEFRMIDTQYVEADAKFDQRVAQITNEVNRQLSQVIAKNEDELDTRRDKVRFVETRFANMITDALRQSMNADMALLNGGIIRGDKIYPAGSDITLKDIYHELPFREKAIMVEMKGDEILLMLEAALKNHDHNSGTFPLVSGMRYSFDMSKKPGHRIVSAQINQKEIDPSQTYKVATDDYLYNGGDSYTLLKNGRIVTHPDDAPYIASLVIDYIKEQKKLAPQIDGRIHRIN